MIKIITFLGGFISHFLYEKKVIEEKEVEIYQYGFEILISTALGFLITMIIGAILRTFSLSILYYIIFVSVRQLTGGYHATSYLKCNLLFSAITLCTLGMAKICYMSNLYNTTAHGLILIAVILSIWKYAPLENPNKPLTASQMKRNHRASLILVAMLEALSSILYVNALEVSILIAFTLLSITALILIKKLEGRWIA